ncbi:hypothetical protein M5D96_005545 [Drosophila gunungcola]|uniref:Transmembrane protein n=1 Tax=Drosophila gunungcola TaxID=103775 RepID=A0A9P9YQH7_9MUSC|nr:hypothetical protein M5D96_005545 [Drosophila gunungcola]
MDCCGNEVRSESIYNMLQALVDSKVVNVQLLSIAVGIFFVTNVIHGSLSCDKIAYSNTSSVLQCFGGGFVTKKS